MPQRKSPPTLRNLSILAVGQVIYLYFKNLVIGKSDDEHKAIECIQDMYRSLPFQLVDEVFNDMFTTLNSISVCMDTSIHDSLRTTMNSIISIICDSRLRELIFVEDDDEMVQIKILECLPRMTGLRYLDFDLIKFSDVDNILTSVSELKNLTSFHHWNCTDEILNVVLHNCKQIQLIDVYSSLMVSDYSIFKCITCKQLKCINLTRTSISGEGCAAVLKHITNLKSIAYWKFSETLDKLRDCNPMSVENIIGCVLVSELSLMRKLFPYLQRFSLSMFEGEFDYLSLPVFPELRFLSIYRGHFYEQNINRILETNGFNLSFLTLYRTECLHVNEIVDIAECCPTLTELKIIKCNKKGKSAPMSHRSSKATFKSLNSLQIRESSVNIEYLLSRCPNITIFKIVDVPEASRDVIAEHLDKIPMTNLTNFTIFCVNALDTDFIYKLLQCLTNLEYLCFRADLSQEEFLALQMYITQNNLDICIETDLVENEEEDLVDEPELISLISRIVTRYYDRLLDETIKKYKRRITTF